MVKTSVSCSNGELVKNRWCHHMTTTPSYREHNTLSRSLERSRDADRASLLMGAFTSALVIFTALNEFSSEVQVIGWATIILFLMLCAIVSATWLIDNFWEPSPQFIRSIVFHINRFTRSASSSLGQYWFCMCLAFLFYVAFTLGAAYLYRLWPLLVFPIIYFYTFQKPSSKAQEPRWFIIGTIQRYFPALFSTSHRSRGLGLALIGSMFFVIALSLNVGEFAGANVLLVFFWIDSVLLFVAYGMRRMQVAWLRSLQIQRLAEKLVELDDPWLDLNMVCSMIKESLGCSRVLILIVSEDRQYVTIEGLDKEAAKYFVPGYQLTAGKGLTWLAINKAQTVLEHDVSLSKNHVNGVQEDFMLNKKIKMGTELIVPIKDETNQIIGTINAQDGRTYILDELDQAALESVTVLLAKVKDQSSRFREQLDLCIKENGTFETPDEILDSAGDQVVRLFGCDLAIIYEIVPETGAVVRFPRLFGSSRLTSSETFLEELASAHQFINQSAGNWEHCFISEFPSPTSRIKLGLDFVFVKEEFTSLAFVPVGYSNIRCALLIMLFKRPHNIISDEQQRRIRWFADSLVPSLTSSIRRRDFLEGFSGPEIAFHRSLNQVGLGKSVLEGALREISEKIRKGENLSIDVADRLDDLEKNFTDFKRFIDIKVASARVGLSQKTLGGLLDEFSSDIREPGVVQIVNDPAIDLEHIDLIWVLYCIITEAITNAFIYAHSRDIRVKYKRMDDYIYIEVFNSGSGFSPDEARKRVAGDKTGIFALERRARKILDADPIEWETSKEAEETYLRWKLPTKPQQYT